MSIPNLGLLEEVNLREAWDHEAHNFTPWLAEHLDLLSKEIGIPLEFEGREVAVENFSADILARNPLDDSIVLIENQLEATDHNHLGQIMTYLAGLDAQTIIWIAADFHEAHLSAISWLNEHTVEPMAFFAVKVKVVRIGTSPLAPIFEVLVKPNRWERQLQVMVQETESLTSLGEFRRAFWKHYLDRYPDELQHGSLGAASSRWRNLQEYNLTVVSYLAQKSVGVFIRGKRRSAAQEVYDRLSLVGPEIARATNSSIGDPEGIYFFTSHLEADTSDRDRWYELADWLYQTANQYTNALNTHMRE